MKALLWLQMRHTCTLVAASQVLDRGERLELLVSVALCSCVLVSVTSSLG